MKKKSLKKNMQLFTFLFSSFFSLIQINAQTAVVLNADGPGTPNNTYELINSALAPGNNAVETPDDVSGGNHTAFGRHIIEVDDVELGKPVFEFISHCNPAVGGINDNEPVDGVAGRQRLEIKTYNPSPANLKGTLGETVQYKWRFRIPAGFVSTSQFTHIHQIKPVGGDVSQPIFTLTLRKGTPNKIELIYVKDNLTANDGPVKSEKFQNISVIPFENTWVEATETIVIGTGTSGSYSMVIKKVSDGTTLMTFDKTGFQTIRPAYTAAYTQPAGNPRPTEVFTANTFIRPKWGIYRELVTNNVPPQKDETIRFSDISIAEGASLSVNENTLQSIDVSIPNPVSNTLKLSKTILDNFNSLSVFDNLGKVVLKSKIESDNVNVSSLNPGLYVLQFENNGAVSKSVKMIKK
jgi:hypothetical protein